ncbi:Uncharacterized conserved protein, DUF1501 family [Litoreibacter ascidiaceicola]|uniref:Uncharacterized conserved protein, DUF1501 family n=1 Tax=Litoreibacter ascidiaceicola TaxID=1486859 RepID=A0A1M4ZCR0_9RHOB|nr:DUF1501 domain-containing protein [Litoreibacter ascidiaceicola]SHF15843.1 Uncharacterized conserved protein, DUF1501 family [Litoreibacter ascidiaceicola]
MADAVSRRRFLLRATALGCSAAASPLMTPMTFAQAPGENRLVVIILRGAMDGLDAVRPIGDPLLRQYRPGLGMSLDSAATELDGFFALHPALAELMPLWAQGDLAVAHAVSTPYRDKRSHFDGQDLLEAGTGADVDGAQARDGWLNRMLQVLPAAGSETAFAIGRSEMKLMSGRAPVSSWSPDGRLDMSPQARLLLEEIYHDDPLFHDTSMDALAIAESLGLASDDSFGMSSSDMRAAVKAASAAGDASVLASFAARRLNEEARIAAFSLGGWDTHRAQTRGITRALGNLKDAILTLRSELGPRWDKTAVVAVTEFGRTARENGTRGTDHGTGGAMILAGGAIRGGRVYGDWPGLEEAALYARRDLMPTSDVRSYIAWLMHGLYGLDKTTLGTVVFPGLNLADDPGLLA